MRPKDERAFSHAHGRRGPYLLRLAVRLPLGFGLDLGLALGVTRSGSFAPPLAVPLLEGLRRDLAFDQQLRELPPLGLALEWHPGIREASILLETTLPRRVSSGPGVRDVLDLN
jgi:hypothetical protein